MRTLVFMMCCVLLVAQSAVAANWNQKSISALGKGGGIKEKANASLEDYRASYIQYYDGDKNQFAHQTVKSAGLPRPIPKLLETDKFVTAQLNKTGLLSYLLFSDGKLVIDEISPKSRLGDLIKPMKRFSTRNRLVKALFRTCLDMLSVKAISQAWTVN